MGAPLDPTDTKPVVKDNAILDPASGTTQGTSLATWVSLIQQYLSVFLLDNATLLAERCVAQYPTSAQAVYLLALCYHRAGDAKRARLTLQRSGVPCSPSMSYLQAQCSLELGDYRQAEMALLAHCRVQYKQYQQQHSTTSMDDWILQTTPCPVPNGAAGLALLGQICRSSQRKERAMAYYRMSLKLDPFLFTSFMALCELGDDTMQAHQVFGVHSTETTAAPTTSTIAKTPLQPSTLLTPMQPPHPPSVLRQHRLPLETPGLTPIPANRTLGAISSVEPLVGRAKNVAARSYYPPSPETPLTAVTRSMAYLRGLGEDEEQHILLSSENQTSNRKVSTATMATSSTTTTSSSNTAPSTNTAPSNNATSDKPEGITSAKSKEVPGVVELLELLALLGDSYQRLCKYQCREALDRFARLPPSQQATGWVLQQQGRAHLELGDFLNAQRSLEAMHRVDPGRMSGLELLSTVYWQLKKEVELAHLAQHVVDWDKTSAYAWCVVGNCFSLQKDHETALVFFGRALQLDDTFCYTHTLSGYEYMANEDFDKAIACFRQALKIDDRHYNAWYGLGAIYHRQEKFDLAEYHFERAASIHPSSSVLKCNLGIAQYANGKAYEALDTLSEAFRLDPHNPQARFQRATIYSALHRPQEAYQELLKVRDAAPREATVHFCMGKVLKRLGRPEEAMKCFLTAMDLDPKDNQLIKSAMDKLDEPDVDEEVAAF